MSKRFATALRIAHRLASALPLLLSFLPLAACAPTPAPEAVQAQQAQQAQAQLQTEAAIAPARADLQSPQTCRPDAALLAPQRAPDCVFGRPELKTLDPDQWARLKVEFERQCYQRAERTVRERLRRLQAASKCG